MESYRLRLLHASGNPLEFLPALDDARAYLSILGIKTKASYHAFLLALHAPAVLKMPQQRRSFLQVIGIALA